MRTIAFNSLLIGTLAVTALLPHSTTLPLQVPAATTTAVSLLPTTTTLEEVTIGHQVWSSKNLDVATFRNGDPIPEANTDAEWDRAIKEKRPAWCYWGTKQKWKRDAAAKYGKLYNWYAVTDPRGLAPEGWHIPTQREWKQLQEMANQSEFSNNSGKMLKSKTGWDRNGNGTDEFGFNALPGGRIDYGLSVNIGEQAWFWSSTPDASDEEMAYAAYLSYIDDHLSVYARRKIDGMSVRCIKDKK